MLFGRKKSEEMEKENIEIQEIKLPTIEEIKGEIEKASTQLPEEKLPIQEFPVPVPTERKFEERKKMEMEELRSDVPFFIKLDRYKEILETIEELKDIMKLIKESLHVLNENEKIRSETEEMIKENIKRFEDKIASMDLILLKPTTHEKIVEKKSFRTEEMKDALGVLKSQIDKLKEELESLK